MKVLRKFSIWEEINIDIPEITSDSIDNTLLSFEDGSIYENENSYILESAVELTPKNNDSEPTINIYDDEYNLIWDNVHKFGVDNIEDTNDKYDDDDNNIIIDN